MGRARRRGQEGGGCCCRAGVKRRGLSCRLEALRRFVALAPSRPVTYRAPTRGSVSPRRVSSHRVLGCFRYVACINLPNKGDVVGRRRCSLACRARSEAMLLVSADKRSAKAALSRGLSVETQSGGGGGCSKE